MVELIVAAVLIVAVVVVLVVALKPKSDKEENTDNSLKAVENSEWVTMPVPNIMSGETIDITRAVELTYKEAKTYKVKSDIDNRLVHNMDSGSLRDADKDGYQQLENNSFRYLPQFYYETDFDFITVLGYNDKNIVSAALVKMVYNNEDKTVTSELEKAYIFEKTDEEYQNITLEYVEELLNHSTPKYVKLHTKYLEKYSALPEVDTLIKVVDITKGMDISEIEELLGGEYKKEVTDESSDTGTIIWNGDSKQPYYISISYEDGKCTGKTIKWEAVEPEVEQGTITEEKYNSYETGMDGINVLGDLDTPSMWGTLISYEMIDWEDDEKSYPYMLYAVQNGSGYIYVELDMYGIVTDISLSDNFIFD